MVADCRLFGFAMSVVACLAATAGGVHAQSATGVIPPAGQQPPNVAPTPPVGQQPPSVAPTPPPSAPTVASTSSSFFPAVTNLGKRLADTGFYFTLGYTEDILGVVSGGNKTGVGTMGEFFVGTVLDLQKLVGIPSASFHITFDERNGYGISGGPGGISGTQGPLAGISGPTRTTRLSQFYWEQGFLNDKIDITLGRTNPTADFATSAVACFFVSSIFCAQPGSWYFSNGNAAYPVSTWGGRVNFAGLLAPGVYFRVGGYEDNPVQFNAQDHGFDWGTGRSTGAFIPAELGYETTTRYPGKYDIGGYYEAASYVTPGGQTRHDRTAVWAQAQQVVWHPDPATKQALNLFAGGIVYNGGAPYWNQFYGGFSDRAPFGPVRPDDTINFVASYYTNNQAFSPAHRGQWIIELNYGFVLVPGVTIKPVTQYVVNPNEIGYPPPIKRPADAWIIGVQFALDAGEFFHFPTFRPY